MLISKFHDILDEEKTVVSFCVTTVCYLEFNSIVLIYLRNKQSKSKRGVHAPGKAVIANFDKHQMGDCKICMYQRRTSPRKQQVQTSDSPVQPRKQLHFESSTPLSKYHP